MDTVSMSIIALAATDIVYVVGGAMLITVGGVNMNIGKKNEPRDLGIVFISGAIMLLIGVLFNVMAGAALNAAATSVFDAILWMIGIAATIGRSNLFAMNHVLLYSGIYFLIVTVLAGLTGQILLAFALVFLALQVITAALAGYRMSARLHWTSGLLAIIDGALFLVLSVVVALGIPPPLGIIPP